MGYLIDTGIFIAWQRGDRDLPSITAAKGDERVALSVVTASELLHGVEHRPSMWDLHVAIQDAMGWLDDHLHESLVPSVACEEPVSIGIPTEDDFTPVTAGWECSKR